MAKIGFVARTRGMLGNAGRAVRSVVAGERAASFGRQAKKHLRELKRRLGWFDEDTFEDEEEGRQRRRAQQMIGLAEQRAAPQPDPYDTGDEVTAPLGEVTAPMAEVTAPMAAAVPPMEENMRQQLHRERLSSSTLSAGMTTPEQADDERDD